MAVTADYGGGRLRRKSTRATSQRRYNRSTSRADYVERTTGRSAPNRSTNRRRTTTPSNRGYNPPGGGGGRSSGRGNAYGTSGGGTYGGGGYSAPAAPPPPRPMSIKDWLAGDEAYQQAVRGGKRTLGDLLSELNRQRGEAKTSFTQTTQDVERNRGLQLERLADEFASRGLIHSGIYGEEQGRFQEQFANQLTQLQQQQASLLADLLSQETNFRREQDLAMEAAKQEALRRRAEKYAIPL